MTNQLSIPSVIKPRLPSKKKTQLEITPTSHLKWDGIYEQNRLLEPEVELLAEELMKWAKTDEAITMYTYVTRKCISKSQWDVLLGRWPQLQRAWDFAKGEIGQRREYLGLIGKFNAGLVAKTLNVFNPYYADHFAWEAKLNKDSQQNATQFNIIMDKFPEVAEVKRIEVKKDE